MIPVVNFVYPLFVNTDLLKEAGVNKVPSTRTEFVDAAKKISALGDNKKAGPFRWTPRPQRCAERCDVVAVGLRRQHAERRQAEREHPRGEERHRHDQGPDRRGRGAPGYLTMKEQDKVEKFTTGQIG